MHERFPLIAIWDDHEFSDDSWGINATYLNGALEEEQQQRKMNSEQVFFEYMPIDQSSAASGNPISGNEVLQASPAHLYPNTRIYRDFSFGQNLHLATCDYRTFRPDHLIAENAFPGQIIMDETTISDYFYAQGQNFSGVAERYPQYIDLTSSPYLDNYSYLLSALSANYKESLLDTLPNTDETLLTQRANDLATQGLADLITVDAYNSLILDAIQTLQDQGAEIPPALY